MYDRLQTKEILFKFSLLNPIGETPTSISGRLAGSPIQVG
ncbi:hypothetical protein SBF1_5210001 [Candidatus Desulfosporosinus infrequens]|uniref:Uncharacterized protein n=1 Tax=Candidatus Desulfosporosinus infrequens TaxID=2043169 RepID=A0A2U3LIG0_9FIRM|nr:hypothetical protein SBF1_5210001 [Candidatus Desulfosporosinus infrequens]